MRSSALFSVLSLTLLSTTPALAAFDPLASFDLSGHSASFARDVRTTWRGLHARAAAAASAATSLNTPRSILIKRATARSPKCVLRAVVPPVAATNATHPAPPTSPASSSSSSSSVLHGSSTASRAVASSSSTSTKSAAGSAPTTATTSSSSAPPAGPSSIFTLKTAHNGSSFFDQWDFWSYGDPTHGLVDYQDSASAWSSGLVQINDAGNAIMRMETTPVVSGNRKSIRISSKETFNGGLLIADVVHMPGSICGSWPAFWSNGPNWPNNGEIDIIEGVQASTQNLMSLHTRSGCSIAQNYGASAVPANTGPLGLNCGADETGNTGCGLRSSTPNNYGTPFNNNGGGVYAMLWDTTGIRVFFFPREAIPADITSDTPLPETWGIPAARWPASTCDPYEFNKDHIAIFDMTLCGDWAGAQSSWTGTNYAGQAQSCAAITGAPSCASYVQNNGAVFVDAYWEVKSVKLFQ